MVKLISDKNVNLLADAIYGFLRLQTKVTHIVEINPPKVSPCIYALWHGDQFAIWGIPDKSNLNVLISNSEDGEVIARAVLKLGFQTVRGSSARKGCVSSTMQLISKINAGESVAITIDGPHGPLHKVKSGVIKLAKETGAPIIPMIWYSKDKTFLKFPSWDIMTTPFGPCKLINLYADPIYVNKDEENSQVAERISLAMQDLQQRADEEFEKAKEQKLWNKK